MGDVYRAYDEKLQVEVALKVPHLKSDDARPRFLQEAQKLARVEHRNVVGIRSWGESGEHVYFTMYLIAGPNAAMLVKSFHERAAHRLRGDELLRMAGVKRSGMSQELRTVLRDRRPYYRMIALWMAEAAEGLQAAHRCGIFHRDIKPGNFLLAPDGRMMVADFGLAKTAEEISTQTGTGVEGTYPYIAPERALGEWARVDHRADLWALGATLYEFLCYERAYPRNGKEVLRDITTKDPEPPRRKVADVPAELEAICLRAMARDPDRRYQEAEQLAEALREWARLGRRRAWAAVAVASLLVMAGGGIAHPASRDFLMQLLPATAPAAAAMSLEVSPSEISLSDSDTLSLADKLRLRLIRVDGTDEMVPLGLCELRGPGPCAVVQRGQLSGKQEGHGELTIGYCGKSATVRVIVAAREAAHGGNFAPSPVPTHPDEQFNSKPAELPHNPEIPAQDGQPPVVVVRGPRPLLLLAIAEDLDLDDGVPARNGGEVERYLREKLADAGAEVRDVREPENWTEEAALALARANGANVVLVGKATARRGAVTRTNHLPDPVIDWTLNLTIEVIEVGGQQRRAKIHAPALPRQLPVDASEYPGSVEDFHRLAQPAISGDGRGAGVIAVLNDWFPSVD